MTTDEGGSGNPTGAGCDDQLALFAGQVSHDLKNPLAAIRMCLELAREEVNEDADEVLSLITRAERGVARMDVLIDDLREYARVESGLRVMVPLDLFAQQMVDGLGEHVAPGQVRGFENLPSVTGDPAQLLVLLRHLVENALHASAWESPVELAAERVDMGWRVRVADRGRGVPADQRERVLEPLVRLDKTVPGSGIGLATCRRIVAAHGGRMGVEDRDGGGAVVWFELPD